MEDFAQIADRLLAHLRKYQRCVVAFSGGVDSAVVAKAAQLALGDAACAVTSVSPSLAAGELELAREVAAEIDIRHEVIRTEEFANPNYVANRPDRCYHCKTELYRQLDAICEAFPDTTVLNGTNLDDQADYRPGLVAAAEHHVGSPLLDCQIDKQTVRALARHWDLSVADKPAMPCLSSRVAYGEQVTPKRLRMIDQAEAFLRAQGFSELRVRYHKGDLARVEVCVDQIPRLLQEPLRSQMTQHLNDLGFRFVTVDANGFRSGNLNTLVPVEMLKRT